MFNNELSKLFNFDTLTDKAMAQATIAHFTYITDAESQMFALLVRNVTAQAVHGLAESEIQPDTVSVLTISIDKRASFSGADTEIQVLVSGNDWPLDAEGQPTNAAAAKAHFDKLAQEIYQRLRQKTQRKFYIWVTPFTATGWAE